MSLFSTGLFSLWLSPVYDFLSYMTLPCIWLSLLYVSLLYMTFSPIWISPVYAFLSYMTLSCIWLSLPYDSSLYESLLYMTLLYMTFFLYTTASTLQVFCSLCLIGHSFSPLADKTTPDLTKTCTHTHTHTHTRTHTHTQRERELSPSANHPQEMGSHANEACLVRAGRRRVQSLEKFPSGGNWTWSLFPLVSLLPSTTPCFTQHGSSSSSSSSSISTPSHYMQSSFYSVKRLNICTHNAV